MAGYSGSIASTWQRAGRAGRRTGTSAAVLVANSSPLDQFIVQHPEYFFGQSPEHGLINPNNLVVQAVLRTMLDDGDYFFFALQPQGQVTAFRADIGSEDLAVLRANRARLQASTTTEDQYQRAVTAFAATSDPAGVLLRWVCRDHSAALDLTGIVLILVFGAWLKLLPITALWPAGAGPLTQLYYLILPSEVSSNLARFDAMRYGLRVGDDGSHSAEEVMALTRAAGFGPEVKRRIMIGAYALSAGYYDAFYLRADDTETPVLTQLDRAIEEREAQRRQRDGQVGQAETWDEWWQAVAADPALAEAAAERSRGLVHHSNEGAQLAAHTSALRAAGFAEVGTLWQRGSSRVLCGVR